MQKSEIVPFGYDDRLVRTVMIDDTPWFVAKDVCAALDIKNPSDAIKILDDDEKNTLEISEGTSLLESPVLGFVNGTPARFSRSLARSARAMLMLGW